MNRVAQQLKKKKSRSAGFKAGLFSKRRINLGREEVFFLFLFDYFSHRSLQEIVARRRSDKG